MPGGSGRQRSLAGLAARCGALSCRLFASSVCPDEMLGRTSGVFRVFGYGALPVGAALAGFVAEGAGIPAVFALCAVLILLLLIPFARDITPAALKRKHEE